MKNVKKIMTALLIMASISTVSYAQEKKGTKTELKEHTCTPACKDGSHIYAHGEKGHVCTKECKKMMKKEKGGNKM